MTNKTFTRTVVEDPENPGDLILELGDEICEPLGWKPGDLITWTDNKDGSFTLTKSDANKPTTE
jgi:hypothetical protein